MSSCWVIKTLRDLDASEMWIHLRIDLLSRQLGRLFHLMVGGGLVQSRVALKCDFQVGVCSRYSERGACASEQVAGGRNR
jgi:hypothetical protein